MRKNEKGSSLIFAVVVIMVIAITIAAALAISFSYYNRSIVNNSKKQAYLTAKSVITNVVDNIKIGNSDYIHMIPDRDGTKNYDVTFSDEMKKEMGCVEQISYIRTTEKENEKSYDKVTITVVAEYGNYTAGLNAELKKASSAKDWQFVRYYEGDMEIKTNINVQNANEMVTHVSFLENEYLRVNKSRDNWKKAIKTVNGKESDFYKNCEQFKKGWFDSDVFFYNDAKLREAIFYGYYQGAFPKFDKNEVKKDISEEAENYLNKQSYYIVPKYPYPDSAPCIIFAHTSSQLFTSWNFKTNLIYVPKESSWYYIFGDGINIKDYFDVTNEAQSKWESFLNDTLHDSTKAEKIT